MKNIIVPVDFSDQTDTVLQLAGQLGNAFGAHVWLLHIAAPEPEFIGYGPGPDCVRDQVAQGLRREHQRVQQLAKQLGRRGVEVTALAVQGPTVEKILAQLGKLDADLVIMGSHGHGAIYRTLLGSISEGVLHRAACPVLIVPAKCRDTGVGLEAFQGRDKGDARDAEVSSANPTAGSVVAEGSRDE